MLISPVLSDLESSYLYQIKGIWKSYQKNQSTIRKTKVQSVIVINIWQYTESKPFEYDPEKYIFSNFYWKKI